jgi:hypothetical protein
VRACVDLNELAEARPAFANLENLSAHLAWAARAVTGSTRFDALLRAEIDRFRSRQMRRFGLLATSM